MKFVHAISAIALLVFLILFGLLGINSAVLELESLDALTNAVMGDPAMLFRLAVFVLALTLVYLLSFRNSGSRDARLRFKTEGGSVEVSLNAASSYLSRLKKEFAAVVSLTPKLELKGNGLRVVIKTGIKSGTRIPELSNLIQQRARQCLADDLGLENIVDIRIVINEISGPPPTPEGEQTIIDMRNDQSQTDASESRNGMEQ